MNNFSESQDYYDHFFRKPLDQTNFFSNFPFSEEKIQAEKQKNIDKSKETSLFSSLFEINTSNKKQNRNSTELFSTNEPQILTTEKPKFPKNNQNDEQLKSNMVDNSFPSLKNRELTNIEQKYNLNLEYRLDEENETKKAEDKEKYFNFLESGKEKISQNRTNETPSIQIEENEASDKNPKKDNLIVKSKNQFELFTNKFDEKILNFKPFSVVPDKTSSKNYLDIFKQKIDQKKVKELSTVAKQTALLTTNKESSLPNKKKDSKFKNNYIEKTKLKKKTQNEVEFKEIFQKAFFPEENSQTKGKKMKFPLFTQEEGNCLSEESLSDIDEVSSFGNENHKAVDLDLDFEQYFETHTEILQPSSKNFKQKTKLNKKLEIKTKRLRVLQEKKVKEYLQETRFTYSSKPLKWRKLSEMKNKLQPHEFRLKEIQPFTAKTGIKTQKLLESIEPYDFFSHFMPERIFEEVARLTNISASLEFYSLATNKNRIWNEVTAEDIKKWFGLIFLFGIVRKYSVNEYWTNDPLLGINSVNRIMNKGRFNEIRKYMSFYDKRKKKEHEKVYPPLDPFYKFRFLIEHINQICKETYTPERELSVDESMISYQGIHRLKVFMPRKPTKWGFKAFVLSEASSGYLCNMILNEGHKRGENEDLLSKRIVLQILHGFEHQGFKVYMDRWYTSADLLSELKKRGIGGCGTIFLSRVGLVNDLKKEVREYKEPGDATFYTNDELMFVAFYQYRRQVYVLSNFHSADWVKVEKVRKIAYFSKKEYKIYDYDAPLMIRNYNVYMGGVDLFNQRVSYYNVDYDIMKWYMRLVFWIFEIAMVNSYLIYCKVMSAKGLKPLASSEYRLEIIKRLTQWSFDPTKPVYRKGVTDKIIENEEEAIDREFHNLNAKRKFPKDNENNQGLNEMKLEIKCKMEYIGVGNCEVCKRKRHKLKKTDFWCRGCQKGVCLSCFDTHKLDIICSKLCKQRETQYLLNYLIGKKKLKVEKTSEFYEEHIQKKKKIEGKPDEKEQISVFNKESTMSQTNPSTRNENITIVIPDEINESKSSISSKESFSIQINSSKKFNFEEFLRNRQRKEVTLSENKKHQEEFQKIRKDVENFYSYLEVGQISQKNNENGEMDLAQKESKKKSNETKEQQNIVDENEKSDTEISGKSKKIDIIPVEEQEVKEKISENPVQIPFQFKTPQNKEKETDKANKIFEKCSKTDEKHKKTEIRLQGRHFPSANPHGKQVKCAYCKIGNSRRTIGYCKVCDVPLCPLYCFEKYHTEEILKSN